MKRIVNLFMPQPARTQLWAPNEWETLHVLAVSVPLQGALEEHMNDIVLHNYIASNGSHLNFGKF